MQRLSASTSETVDAIKERFEGINSSFESMKSIFEATLAVLSGGELAKALAEVAERAEGIRESAQIFSMTTTELQGLQVVAEETGVSSEKLQRTMATLEQKMRNAGESGGKAAEKFNQLGITTEQLQDPTFSVEDAMAKLGSATNSNAELLGVLGARGAALIPMMRELATNHEAVAEAASEVGALLPQEIDALTGYHEQWEITSTAMDNFKARVLSGVIPAMETLLTQMTQFSANAENAEVGSNILKAGIDALATAFDRVVMAGRILVDVFVGIDKIGVDAFSGLVAIFDGMKESVIGVAMALADLEQGHTAKIGDDLTHGFKDMESALAGSAGNIKADFDNMVAYIGDDVKEAHDKIQAVQDALTAPPKLPPSAPTGGGGVAPKVDFSNISSEMDKTLDKIDEQASTQISKAFQKITADVVSGAKQQEDAEVGSIDRQIVAVQELGSTHQLSAQKELSQTTALLNEKWVAEQTYFDKVKTMESGNQAQVDKLNSQEEASWQKHLNELERAQDKATTDMNKQWQKIADTIGSAFETNIDKMLRKTETFGQGVRGIFTSLAGSLINSFVKIGVEWVEQEALKLATSKLTALGVIGSSAGAAGAAATASFAQAPWPVDLGAPAFGAGIAADVLSYSSIVSAEGGYNVPAGVNPLVQMHEREMTLPAELADNVREGMGGGNHYHFHIQTNDASSFHDYVHQSSQRASLGSAMKTLRNRGGGR